MPNPLRVLDAARSVADNVNELADLARPRLLHDKQLREAAGSIAANIREGYGRRPGAERNQFLRYARGSAEEADEHLRVNVQRERIAAAQYWRLHNRLVVIAKMLGSLMERGRNGTPAPPSRSPS
ncbi:MAG: four helix bundle protein, partial [Gemmatimonadaceae bacterium]